MRLLILIAVLMISTAPAWCQDLKPELKSDDVVIENTFKTASAPKVIAAQPVDLDDLSNVVAAKEQKRKARIESNRKLDLQYKAIPNKPNIFPHLLTSGQRIPHPFKRADLWMDYHQDTMRKYRTRGLPTAQGGGLIMSTIFSAVAAFH